MKTVCVVQARLNSTRLPAKVLLPLNGRTVISEVIERCYQIPGVDQVVCSIPTKDHELADHVAKFCAIASGPEHDVLHRYYRAAYIHDADIIMRVTGDCPLISPDLCGAVLARLKSKGADYASNVHPRTFPHGMDCEVFTWDTLERAELEAREDEREHVTTWMLRADIKRANLESPWKIEGRLTLDTETDYKSICAYFGHQPYQRLQAA